MRSILMQSLPRWYDLRLRKHSVIIEIHPNLVAEVIERVTRFIDMIEGSTQFEGAPLSTKGRWGYAGVCKNIVPITPGWTAIECDLPHGDQERSVSYSRTLAILFHALNWPKIEVEDIGPRQLLVVTGLLSMENLGGWALSIDISHEIYLWIKAQNPGTNNEIASTMKQIWMRLDGRKTVKPWGPRHFQSYLHENGGLYLSVPGNAADLTPSFGPLGDIREIGDDFMIGYCLEPHNIDGPLQQLTLLAGVIKLRELSGL